MEIGDTVKFIDGLYPDEKGAKYKVVEINGDRAVIEFICDLHSASVNSKDKRIGSRSPITI